MSGACRSGDLDQALQLIFPPDEMRQPANCNRRLEARPCRFDAEQFMTVDLLSQALYGHAPSGFDPEWAFGERRRIAGHQGRTRSSKLLHARPEMRNPPL